MIESHQQARIFASGERVEPGLYQDLESGAVVRILAPCELPHRDAVIRFARLFARIDEEREAAEAIENHEAALVTA